MDIAASFGVSRGPVREAFRALGQMGLVRVEKNRGVFVREVSLEEANEFFEVRAALEGLIGRLAARRIAADEVQALRGVVKRMHPLARAAGGSSGSRGRGESRGERENRENPRTAARSAPKPTSTSTSSSTTASRAPRSRRCWPTTAASSTSSTCTAAPRSAAAAAHPQSTAEHEAIVEAVAAGDARRAPARRTRARQPHTGAAGPGGCRRRCRGGCSCATAALREGRASFPARPMSPIQSPGTTRSPVTVNGTSYRWPLRPVAVVCIDGGDPRYLQRFLAEGAVPNIARFVREGFAGVADGSMPSFTCPNNMSMITGTPTAKHGISGNFYLDTATWQPVVMTGPELLRGDTIIARFAAAGAKVVSITAKDKLRRQLGKGLDVRQGHVSLSSEFANSATLAENGIENVLEWVGMPQPGMYSMELSLFVLEAGLKLLEQRRPDLLFLSLTDWVQHKWSPEEADARRFYEKLDSLFGRLAAADITLALTADHGMSDKSNAAGEPNVIWLQDILDAEFGAGETIVICPITDAFVGHHGALGGFVRVWSRGTVTAREIIGALAGIEGIEMALDKATACRMFDMPPDREGDVAVVAREDTCIGSSARNHDLAGLAGHRLRTHGGVSEAKVPFILNRPLNDAYRAKAACEPLKSWQIFDYAVNGTV
ncbi:MAG: phosphonoacetate hydrolase [Rubrivivax sp.]